MFQLKLIAHDCEAYAVGCLPVPLSFLVGHKAFAQLRDLGWLVGWPLAAHPGAKALEALLAGKAEG